ncbi:MAG: GTP-binding protein [Gammaproteobacteria bacterium]|nr:GTP-binding protein [Gammaproteobacteria bacterium]
MNFDQAAIRAVPTNIITGFLGVGKTTAILHLLKNKPANERWAVLVNEFGEIGVDGSLFEGRHSKEEGVFIREIPGGCMCCAAGLPMQVALNELLSRAKPDRLLIEPTGLGHPEEVLQVLSAEHYQDALSLQKVLTLVDARKLSDPRYTTHDIFKQQIAIADVVVGNKTDLYQAMHKPLLEEYFADNASPGSRVVFTQNSEISIDVLDGATTALATINEAHHHHHASQQKPLLSEQPFPDVGYLKALNHGEGFESVGWRFSAKHVFDYKKLFDMLSNINANRMKAVFITNKGVFAYSLTTDGLTEMALTKCTESRIEIISESLNTNWENQLIDCITS